MKKLTLKDIRNHFNNCIDEGLTIGEQEEILLNILFKKAEKSERYEKVLKEIATPGTGKGYWEAKEALDVVRKEEKGYES